MAKTLFLVLLTTALINNIVLSQFLGICPFLGVSKNIKTAAGMGGAVIGVITISSVKPKAAEARPITKFPSKLLQVYLIMPENIFKISS